MDELLDGNKEKFKFYHHQSRHHYKNFTKLSDSLAQINTGEDTTDGRSYI
jgi:hypothetical protein